MTLATKDAEPTTAVVRRRSPRQPSTQGTTLKLKPADPFELIRWLARSQSDPRKAVAEFVQNSLDAGARTIQIERRRQRGVAVISVKDDGEGVIPDVDREEALKYLATNIGHSRKLGLTPQERHARVIAGQYGVGLLGFWAVGQSFELRTRVAGSKVLALHMVADQQKATILSLPTRLDAPPTYTQVVVAKLHETAQRLLSGRRLAEYLAAELRGQLLGRDVTVTIHDRLGRGPGQRHFHVVPLRFMGERLSLPERFAVPGYPDVRIELYLARGDAQAAIQVACAGTLVADNLGDLSALGLGDAPWVGRGLAGLVDFAGFQIPPGTRRGVQPDTAAGAFVEAMERICPLVNAELARLDTERTEASARDVARDLRRALRGFRQRLPHYTLPEVTAQSGEGIATADATGAALPEDDDPPILPSASPDPELFPPGPLQTLVLRPAVVEVPVGGQRRVQAVARDADGRNIEAELALVWTLDSKGLALVGGGRRPAVRADALAEVGHEAWLRVEAHAADQVVTAEALVRLVDADESQEGASGIPEPEFVSDPSGLWRSRMRAHRWQVNDAHEDYVALRSDVKARLRYLLSLLAKEIIYGTYGAPADETLLERFVEILAHAERNLRRK